jgi:hypothetical protein
MATFDKFLINKTLNPGPELDPNPDPVRPNILDPDPDPD